MRPIISSLQHDTARHIYNVACSMLDKRAFVSLYIDPLQTTIRVRDLATLRDLHVVLSTKSCFNELQRQILVARIEEIKKEFWP